MAPHFMSFHKVLSSAPVPVLQLVAISLEREGLKVVFISTAGTHSYLWESSGEATTVADVHL